MLTLRISSDKIQLRCEKENNCTFYLLKSGGVIMAKNLNDIEDAKRLSSILSEVSEESKTMIFAYLYPFLSLRSRHKTQ